MRSEQAQRIHPVTMLAGNDPARAERIVSVAGRRSERDRSEPDPMHASDFDIGPSGVSHDPEYWLRHSHGFLVDSESGAQVGVVDDIELAPDSGETVALIVASGWLGRSIRRIAAGDVCAIAADERRLIVRDDAVRSGGAGSGQA